MRFAINRPYGAKARLDMTSPMFGKDDLAMAKAYIDAGPAALAVTLRRLQVALGLEQPIMLPEDPEEQQKAFAIKLRELRALLAAEMFAKAHKH
jgi:hypothetical protein